MTQTNLFGGTADSRKTRRHVVVEPPKRVRKPFQSLPPPQQRRGLSAREAGELIAQRIQLLAHPLITSVVLEDFNNYSGYLHVYLAGSESDFINNSGTVKRSYALANTLVPEKFNLKSITNPIRAALTDMKNNYQISARITSVPERQYTEDYGMKNFQGYTSNSIQIDYEI